MLEQSEIRVYFKIYYRNTEVESLIREIPEDVG